MAPGLLYVTMQPQGDLPSSQFHDWYNNEHGPLRLRLPFVTNGLRYRAVDLTNSNSNSNSNSSLPEWLAIYDITDMTELTQPTYLALRGDGIKTPREKQVMARIAVDRRLYDFLDDRRADDFTAVESLPDDTVAGRTLVAVSTTVPADQEPQLNRWYDEEHLAMLSKVPGWLRSRRFVTSSIDPNASREFLTLHEYAPVNGLGGPQHLAAMSTPWAKEIASIATSKHRRVYNWYYTFGPAPRELTSLASPVTTTWSSNDGKTRTLPSPVRPAVESYITTHDGAELAYRLEGNPHPTAPLVVLSNSILVDYGIWDGFVESFLSRAENQGYRVLRYQTRGRTRECGTQENISIDVLAADIVALLDALRVEKAAALIGVSLGGVTVLNTALLYPGRVARFVACDTNAVAPDSNRKAWEERVAMAEADGACASSGERVVGETLAEATTRRWFVGSTWETQRALAEKVKRSVAANSLDGFRRSVQALCAYDVRERMARATVPGLFVVGGEDGVLPRTMRGMAEGLKGGAELRVIEGAGHLPMVEKPEAFCEVVMGFLSST